MWPMPPPQFRSSNEMLSDMFASTVAEFYEAWRMRFSGDQTAYGINPWTGTEISPRQAFDARFLGFLSLAAPPLRAARGAQGLKYLYQKVGPLGQHLKFGIASNPATRYTSAELAGGRLKVLASGSRDEMLQLERNLHETLPIGPEEGQSFYILKQVEKGLIPPPYP